MEKLIKVIVVILIAFLLLVVGYCVVAIKSVPGPSAKELTRNELERVHKVCIEDRQSKECIYLREADR